MARQHGKATVVIVNSVDISLHCTQSDMGREADSHDTTGYGVDDYTYAGGLKGATFTVSGRYDTTGATSPRVVIESQLSNIVPVKRRVEGTGSGKPQQAFNAEVTKYSESSPYNDMVTWSAEFKISGPVDVTPQV